MFMCLGPIVRTAPNELSFNTAQSWKDIYDFRQGHLTFIKSEFYDGGSFADRCGSIVSERDPQVHGIMRKYLSHAFSARSLTEQEFLIAKSVDAFIRRIGEDGAKSIDIVMAFTLMSFDIIGELAFGETFQGTESKDVHPWITRMTGAMMQGAVADSFKRFPTIAKIALTFFGGHIRRIIQDTKINEQLSIELVERRVRRKTDRKDFYTRILENREPDAFSDIQLAAHASDFVLAGSETSSTCLSTITYYLFKTPHAAKKLQEEVRGAFASYSDINAASTASLEYMHAVILEGLRIHPPLPFALPRIVPKGGDTVDGHFLPAGTIVSTNPVAASLDPANFEEPHIFKPERWLGKNERDNLSASQPFSLGPRGCIGRSLGWVEMNTTLAKLHFKYDLELLEPGVDWLEDSRMHTLWEKPSFRVQVTTR
ncbi:hypothetical protein MMC07_009556, partial [Pseudocyphellaria aurata]|nr:hypothetical protein [Pseudocyphellaria aurata]